MEHTSSRDPGCSHSVNSEESFTRECKILEMIAKGHTLREVLDEIVVFTELQLKRGALCSILLLDGGGKHLFHGSAPGLPEEYIEKINGMAIGPCAGSCGTAVYRKEPVIVENTGNDPLWADYRDLARTYNLHACWSVPICCSDGKVLGAFAVYHPKFYRPSQHDIRSVRLAVHLVSTAIQQHRLKDGLKFIEKKLQREIRERQKYELIANTAKEFMTVINRDYVYEAANKAYCEAHGKILEGIIGKTVNEIWGKEKFETFIKMRLDDCFRGKEVQDESYLEFSNVGKRYFSIKYYSCFNQRGQVTHAVVVSCDVTNRKQMEEALTEREELYRQLVELSPDLILIHTEKEIVFINDAGVEFLGASDLSQIIGKPVVNFISPDSREMVQKRVAELLKQRNKSPAYEHKAVRLDGTERDVEVVGVPVTYQNRPAVQIMVRDVTERKESEKALIESEKQLRFLSTKLLVAQEEERKRIAAELHDNIGQYLSAIKYGMENVMYRCKQHGDGSNPGIHSVVESLGPLISLVQSAIQDTRRVYMDLRPSILDDFGIIATIEWFLRQFRSVYTDIHIEMEVGIEEGEIPKPLKIMIYRIIQEAFHNVAKHSKAELVNLSLTKSEDSIILIIEDNGGGFDPDFVLSKDNQEKGLGLTSMRERTELSGGSFSLASVPKKGTLIRASWPLKEGETE